MRRWLPPVSVALALGCGMSNSQPFPRPERDAAAAFDGRALDVADVVDAASADGPPEANAVIPDAAAPPDGGPAIHAPFPIPWDALGLPRTDAGAPIVVQTPEVVIAIDPALRTPARAYAQCVAMVLACARETGRPDACAMAAPRCNTPRPWEESAPCCPEACAAQMGVRQRAGLSPWRALREVFAEDRACFPGLALGDAGAP